MKRIPWPLAMLLGLLAAACSSVEVPPGTGGAGGESATSSSSSSSTSSTGAGADCHGVESTWKVLTTGPIPCKQSSDCCVIINGCLNEAQVVSAEHMEEAKAVWPTCDDQCSFCIPPAVQVECVSGACAGKAVILPPGSSTDILQDHCGNGLPVGAEPGKLNFTCAG
ncbi:Hypothetical protein A7982_11166 [Minicystis rosea]|nr:Hypothetical protein A7982_11166 [Minicystis rosea]